MTILSDALVEVQKKDFKSKNGEEVVDLYRRNILDETDSLYVIAHLLDIIDQIKEK